MQFPEAMLFIPKNKQRKTSKNKLDPKQFLQQSDSNCVSINKILDYDSQIIESASSWIDLNEDLSGKAKKMSFDERATLQKITLENLTIDSEIFSTCEDGPNSYFSCMANLEKKEKNEDFPDFSEVFDLDDAKHTILKKIEDSTSKIKKTNKRKFTMNENKEIYRNYERIDFKKLEYDEIISNFQQKLSRKSKLSEKLKETEILSLTSKKFSQTRKIKVFPFGNPYYMELEVNYIDSVSIFIQKIIQKYMKDPKTDKSLLKFPTMASAYELRYLDEDYGFKPDLTLEALDETQRVCEYFLDSMAFGLKQSIYKEKKTVTFDLKENVVSLEIIIKQENFTTILAIQTNKTGLDVLKEIKIKNKKLNIKNYNILEDFNDVEGMENEGMRELDLNMPLRNLISHKLYINEKKFADEPNKKSNKKALLKNKESIYASETIIGKNNLSKLLFNDIIACKTEEFALIKSSDKDQKSTVTIDQIKLTFKNIKLSSETKTQTFLLGVPNLCSILGYFDNFLEGKTKEIQLEDILIIDMQENDFSSLVIEYHKEKTKENNLKNLKFENASVCLYVLAKVKYLMNIIHKSRSLIE